jgi:hypothetical protein
MNGIRTSICSVLLSFSLVFLTSCSGPSVFNGGTRGGGGGTPPGGGGGGTNGQISVALTSALTPITGITVLAFDVSVVGVTLASSTGSVVTLRSASSAQRVELTHLQTDSVSLGSFAIIPGTYNTLSTSFLPLTLTVFNQTGGTLAGTCLKDTVCMIVPNSAGTITLTTAPFPFVIGSAQQTGLQLTVDIGNLVKSDLSLDFSRPGILSATKLPLPAQPGGQLTSFDDQIGRVTSLNSTAKTFSFQSDRATFTVNIDTGATTPTVFDGFNSCPPADITCLKNDQSVSVDLGLKPDGTVVAREIQLEDALFDEEFEGTIFLVDSPTQFKVVPTNLIRGTTDILTPAGIDVGTPVIVQLQLNPTFEVDTKGFRSQISASLGSFENASDTTQLRAGQNVEIRVKAEGTKTTFPVILTDRVRLRFTHVTGHVTGAVAGSLFNIQDLPPLFGPFGSTGPAQVQTFTTGARVTTFEGAPNGLANGDLVAMRALFIKNSAPPFFTTKVRKR